MSRRRSPGLTCIGHGRSAVVHRTALADGSVGVRKVFVPDSLATLVFRVLDGAPNPYGWCRAAIETAILRRRVLARLVALWFGKRVRLPQVHGVAWDETERAFEIRMEFVRGTHLPLARSVPSVTDGLLEDLRERVMRPLQQHLDESGFIGLVWQAGRGNPVACGNFMLDATRAPDACDTAEPRWIWVDLESGVPALFPLDPRALLGFYLPQALARRRPLFDDVDVDRLRDYVLARADDLTVCHGEAVLDELRRDIEELSRAQAQWRALSRTERGVDAALAAGDLTPERAAILRTRPLRWLGVQAGMALGSIAGSVARRTASAWRSVRAFPYGRRFLQAVSLVTSQRARAHASRVLVRRRITAWRRRGFLDAARARRLRRDLHRNDVSSYITDFGVHLMSKPLVKGVQYGLGPALYALGFVDVGVVAFVAVAGGAIFRTAYTMARSLQALVAGRSPPWLALGVGVLPVVGNAAYPCELVRRGVGGRGLGPFVLHETCASVGRAIPIWGGADTLTEHTFNRLPRLLRRRHKPIVRAAEPRLAAPPIGAQSVASAVGAPDKEPSHV